MKLKIIILYFFLGFNSAFSQHIDFNSNPPSFYNSTQLDSIINSLKEINNSSKNQINKYRGVVLLYLADAHKIKQEFTSSLTYYNEAEQIFIKLKDYNNVALTYISLSEFYRSKYDLDNAEKYLDLAKEKIDNYKIADRVVAKYWNRKAAIYIEKYSDLMKSIECSNKVLEISRSINDKELEASSLNEIAYAYENLNNPLAEQYYLKSIQLNEELGNSLNQANVIINLIRFYSKNGMQQKIEPYLKQGLQLALKTENEQTIKGYYEQYYFYNESIKNFKSALYFHKKYNELERKEFIRKWNTDIIDAERKYESQRKDRLLEISNLKLKNQANELINSKRKFQLVIVLLSILLISIITFILFVKKIKHKNKELMRLSNQNEFLLSEANHRINNNLQLIIILLNNEIKKDSNSNSINKVLLKIQSIATLHEHLYQKGENTNLELQEYLKGIKANFNEIFNDYDIKTQFYCDELKIDADTAMYIGLILSELYINSIKHAFKNQTDKNIFVKLSYNQNKINFIYIDNGMLTIKKVIKPKLISKLCKQLNIDYKINTDNGFSFSFNKIYNL